MLARHLVFATAMTAAAVVALSPHAHAQQWRPTKPVEIVVPTGASGTNDQMARLLQALLQTQKLVAPPVVVVNKPGGNQNLSAVYVAQHKGDPHYLLYSTATLFTNEIAGLSTLRWSEFAPVALFLVDHSVITVKADSTLKSMRDIVARLKADPGAVTFGLVSRGGPNHLALAQAIRAAGIDPKQLRLVVFKTNAESMTAIAGGHIHAAVSSISAALPQVEAGATRILAIAAPARQSGRLAQVPTLREEGLPATGIANWRGVVAAPGTSPDAAAFWAGVTTKIVATDEWKQQLERNNVTSDFISGESFRKWLADAYHDTRAVMMDLGLAK